MPARRAGAPRLTSLPAAALPTAAAGPELLGEEETVEAVALEGALPAGHAARHVTIAGCRVTAALAGARLADLHVRDSAVSGADLANLHAPKAALRRCALEHVRLTGATLTEASLSDVRLADCRADLVSFAGATFERVVIADTDLTEATFDEAFLRDVRLERCRLAGASLHRVRLQRVELVGCDIAGVRSVGDLRGALMPWDDIVANAGALAAAAGIGALVDDED